MYSPAIDVPGCVLRLDAPHRVRSDRGFGMPVGVDGTFELLMASIERLVT